MAEGMTIKNKQETLHLFQALWLPHKLEIIYWSRQQKAITAKGKFNQRAEEAAKATLSPYQPWHFSCQILGHPLYQRSLSILKNT